ncbi:MAG: hypothetical protein EOL86_07160 [Deltaproteobacteria bacterium]|nr:hypothetical protein [Deltaproteobacteria bacterium]
MTSASLPSAYTSQSLGAGPTWDATTMMDAKVSTRTVAVQLGRLGLSYSAREVTFTPRQGLDESPSFDQELELNRLTHHVGPFRPAGASIHNATVQRLGLSAYAHQASLARPVASMLSVVI